MDVDVAGIRARCWHGGCGPRVVLLHGGAADAEAHWSAVWDDLADVAEVVVPDPPGFGASDPLDDASWSGLTRWVQALLASLGLTEPVLVGNSLGATLTRLVAQDATASPLAAAVLVNGGQRPRAPTAARVVLRTRLGRRLLIGSPDRVYDDEHVARMFPQPAAAVGLHPRPAQPAGHRGSARAGTRHPIARIAGRRSRAHGGGTGRVRPGAGGRRPPTASSWRTRPNEKPCRNEPRVVRPADR